MGSPGNQVRDHFMEKVVSCAESCRGQKRSELRALIGSSHEEIVFIGICIGRRKGNGEKRRICEN